MKSVVKRFIFLAAQSSRLNQPLAVFVPTTNLMAYLVDEYGVIRLGQFRITPAEPGNIGEVLRTARRLFVAAQLSARGTIR